MMAHNFQPNSPYGPPYQPGSYYPTYQQFPTQQQTSTSPFSQQNVRQPGAYNPSPNFNLGRFESNTQTTTPNQSLPFSTSPFNAEMLKQLANASIPLPPPPNFPPVPIPNRSFPQYPQTSTPLHPVQSQPSANVANNPSASEAYDPRFPNQSLYRSNPDFAHGATSTHSIEVQRKDQGSAFSRAISQEGYPKTLYEPHATSQNPVGFDGSALSTQAKHNETLYAVTRPHNLGDSQKGNTSLLNTYHTSQQLQPGSSHHEVASRDYTASHQNPQTFNAMQDTRSSPSPNQAAYPAILPAKRKTGDITELRELAKGALLSLAPHSIQLAHLAREGIDASLLRQLYTELGINVEEPGAQAVVAPQATPQDVAERDHDNNHLPGVNVLTLPDDHGHLTVPTMETITALSDKPLPSVSPSLERKDRIAQLLAAKTGRPSPMCSFSESVASTEVPETRSGQDAPPNAANTTFHTDLNLTTQEGSKSVGILQAEALKQKMNQMRTGSSYGKQTEADEAASVGVSTGGGSSGKVLHITTSSIAQDHAQSGPLSSIPGLFMTSADPSFRGLTGMGDLPEEIELSDPARGSQKRSLEPDAQQGAEPSAKRRNTDTTGEAMDIDASTEDDEASEGEIVDFEADTTSQAQTKVIVPATTSTDVSRSELGMAGHDPSATVRDPNRTTSGIPTNTVATPTKTRLTSAQIAEKAEMLKARFLRQRAERQRLLQDGLPDLEAEVQKTRSRLAQQQTQLAEVRQQIGRLDRELVETQKSETALVEEIAQLEKQLKEGLFGQTQYANELKQLNGDSTTSEQASEPALDGIQSDSQVPPPAAAPIPGIAGDVLEKPEQFSLPDETTPVESADQEADPSSQIVNMTDDGGARYGTDPPAEVVVGDLETKHQALQQDEGDTGTPYDEMDDSELPAANQVKIGHGELDDVDDYAEEGELDYSSEGSASMSEGGSEARMEEDMEYEPAEPPASIGVEAFEEGEYDPEDVEVEQTSPNMEMVKNGLVEEEDNPEAFEPMEGGMTPTSQISEEMVDSPPLAPPEAANHAPNGISGVDSHLEPEEAAATVADDNRPPGAGEVVVRQPFGAEDTAPRTGTTQQAVLTNAGPTNGTSTGYTPYQSPLSSFQSFRYHEQFQKDAPKDGFRSLTYSNNIDPSVPLCSTELADGVCQDPNCEEQHFRHLGLSDDKILVSLSSAQGIDKKLKDVYLRSLKEEIAGLREKGVKEFEDVANALSVHRRHFLKQHEEGEM